MDIERLLRTTLSEQAAEVKASPKLWEQVKTKMLAEQGAGGATGSRLPVARLLHRLPRWQAVTAAAFGATLLLGSLVMALSPAAQAWARDKLVEIIAWRMVRTNNGYQLVREPVEVLMSADAPATLEKCTRSFVQLKGGPGIKDGPQIESKKLTLEDARAMVDFPVRTPGYLPEGYEGPDIAALNGPGKAFVHLIYRAPSDTLDRDLLSISFMEDTLLAKIGDALREVEVRGRKGYWAEYPVASITGGPDVQPTVRAGHLLSWEEDGVVIQLRSDAGLSLEEMFKIAASLK